METMGLVTILVRRLTNTSERSPGGAWSTTSRSCSVTGNRKLPTTAHNAAINVLSRYLEITTLNLGPKPEPALAILAATSVTTRTGAMAFSALTNTTPRIPMPFQCGTVSPRNAPIVRPMSMRSTRLILLHLTKTLINFIS